MRQTIRLSQRLQAVASYLPKGALFADIGSDHAYLPCYVCSRDQTAKAIAGEVNEGPYQRAHDTVNAYQLSETIDVRLGDGLQVLRENEVEQIIIAGMGGPLIVTILDSGKEKLHHVKQIIAQPNIDARSVRKWFMQCDYHITNEQLIEENGHTYEIIVAEKPTNPTNCTLTERQLLFGPVLLEKKSNIFFKKWKHEYRKRQTVLNAMHHATLENEEKTKQFKTELRWMEEVLEDEKNTT